MIWICARPLNGSRRLFTSAKMSLSALFEPESSSVKPVMNSYIQCGEVEKTEDQKGKSTEGVRKNVRLHQQSVSEPTCRG